MCIRDRVHVVERPRDAVELGGEMLSLIHILTVRGNVEFGLGAERRTLFGRPTPEARKDVELSLIHIWPAADSQSLQARPGAGTGPNIFCPCFYPVVDCCRENRPILAIRLLPFPGNVVTLLEGRVTGFRLSRRVG